MDAFRCILVPTDFSDASNRATGLAVDLAQTVKADLVLAHFWGIPAYPYLTEGYQAADFTASMARAAEAQMAKALAKVRMSVPSARSICRMGMPWEEILKAVDEERADAIVMGTHARHGLNRLLLGSVAEKVVRSSPVPVLTVPPVPESKDKPERA
jgi:nucleotide-binding universal stress UspA family protein